MTEYKTSYEQLKNRIFSTAAADFDSLAVELSRFQFRYNKHYREYCEALRINPENIQHISEIPFLPIQFFKNRDIKTGEFAAEAIFESSGTTGTITSKHAVKDLSIYEKGFSNGFAEFYGNARQYCIIGLLPSYLERKNSSLVYMVDKLISDSQHPNSGFYLYEFDELKKVLESNEKTGQHTLLIGVSYALLDFSEQHPMQLKNTIVMETGGMKGRLEELSRKELHRRLKEHFGVTEIHSEYGMTELLSQAYSKGDGIFRCSSTMRIIARETDNPLELMTDFENHSSHFGGINVIDLANINSCCFIATEDAGITYADGSFEVSGRLENSDIRGCGLMIV